MDQCLACEFTDRKDSPVQVVEGINPYVLLTLILLFNSVLFKPFTAAWEHFNGCSSDGAKTETIFIRFSRCVGRTQDPRTVMKKPRWCCVRQKAGGMYIHLGLKAGLLRQLREIHTRATNFDIQMNVDGIRAYNNSRTQPFAIGIYCGKNKPDDAQQLMSDTVTELADVSVNGVSRVYQIHKLTNSSYDSSARAFLKQVN
ncbi:hypothetical protein CLF_111460 [Clonorchis sinensis]|uniref:Uncharacterized protein n=1 Tax=Clonorchis sinensis TaxID=79923 RepID=G7YUX5_CLOSI|nr:hypothetical protein CLF_111460 [Clonorchis sinensis]